MNGFKVNDEIEWVEHDEQDGTIIHQGTIIGSYDRYVNLMWSNAIVIDNNGEINHYRYDDYSKPQPEHRQRLLTNIGSYDAANLGTKYKRKGTWKTTLRNQRLDDIL